MLNNLLFKIFIYLVNKIKFLFVIIISLIGIGVSFVVYVEIKGIS